MTDYWKAICVNLLMSQKAMNGMSDEDRRKVSEPFEELIKPILLDAMQHKINTRCSLDPQTSIDSNEILAILQRQTSLIADSLGNGTFLELMKDLDAVSEGSEEVWAAHCNK